MTVDGGLATTDLWQVIAPTGTTDTNYVTNPSFETGTTGWTPTSATLVPTIGASRYGGYGGRLTASAANGRGEYSGPQFAGGTPVVFSVYVKADSPLVVARLAYGATVVDVAHPGDGKTHRLEIPTVAVAATTPVLAVRDGRSSGWTAVDIDGVQFEQATAASTYIDGDQDGCKWTGLAHASTSQRDGRSGQGGAIKTFHSIGLDVVSQKGLGRAPVDVVTQSQAIKDGSIYQGTVRKERVFTLTCEIMYPSGLAKDLHTNRRTAFAPFALDTRSNRGPVTLRYTGGGDLTDPRVIRAHNEDGWTMDDVEPTTEVLPLRFLANDPDFESSYDTAALLAPSQSVTSVKAIAIRTPDNVWSNAGGGPVSNPLSPIYAAAQMADGRIIVGGNFTDMGGVAACDYLAVWDPATATWSALGGATPNSTVLGIDVAANGDVYICGSFQDMAGIAAADYVAKWTAATNTWSAVGPSGANTGAYGSIIDPSTGYWWIAGAFTTIGGVSTANGTAYWNGSTWVNAATGFGSHYSDVDAFEIGPDGKVYSPGTAGLYRWDTTTWTLVAATGGSAQIQTLKTWNGSLYVGGFFTTFAGVACNAIARWTGVSAQPLGTGLANPGTSYITKLSVLADGSALVASGLLWSTIGGITPPDNIALWNGSAWLPYSADPPNTATHGNDTYRLYGMPNGYTVLNWMAAGGVGTFGTTLIAESITSVTNAGSASAYPVIKLVITQNCTLYSITNLTTGQVLRFNGTLLAGEIVTIDLRANRSKTVRSNYRDLIGLLLSASDFSTFALAPGANRIALYCTDGSATAYLYWRNRYETAD